MELHAKIRADLWAFVRQTYEVGNFTGSIVASVQFLSDVIRKKSGLSSDGQPLVGTALGGSDPLIKVNALRTDSDRDEQKGIESILRGIYTGIRNPRVHETSSDTAHDADQVIMFIDWLTTKIAQSRSPFDPDTIMQRVLDPHFVPTLEYAKLIATEVPLGLRLDVVTKLSRLADGESLRNLTLFSDAMWSELTPADQIQYLAVLNEILLGAQSEIDFVAAVNLSASNWSSIPPLAKTRAEHRIIRSIGNVKSHNSEYLADNSLELLAVRLAPEFTLKRELVKTLTQKVCSSEALEYFCKHWIEKYSQLSPNLNLGVALKLKALLREGDWDTYINLTFLDDGSAPPSWVNALKGERDSFDGIPF